MMKHVPLALAVLALALVLNQQTTEAGSVSSNVNGITLDEIPLSWKYEIHVANSEMISGSEGYGYYSQAPTTHGLLIEDIRIDHAGEYFLLQIDGVVARRWYRDVSYNPASSTLTSGLAGPILVRPGESFIIRRLNGLNFNGEISMKIAIIPASELPPIPAM